MDTYSKILDTIIKAPLWFFFAALLMSAIPLLNLDFLVRLGVASDLKIAGYPVAIFAISFFSLFVSSAVARSYQPIWKFISGVFERVKWRYSIRSLPSEARAILGYAEEQAVQWFFYDPRAPAIKALRDADIIAADIVSSNGEDWGKFRLSYGYTVAYSRHRALFRSALKYAHDDSETIRNIVRRASRNASTRV